MAVANSTVQAWCAHTHTKEMSLGTCWFYSLQKLLSQLQGKIKYSSGVLSILWQHRGFICMPAQVRRENRAAESHRESNLWILEAAVASCTALFISHDTKTQPYSCWHHEATQSTSVQNIMNHTVSFFFFFFKPYEILVYRLKTTAKSIGCVCFMPADSDLCHFLSKGPVT